MQDYSIVDMMTFSWTHISKPLGVQLEKFPNVLVWRQHIKELTAVREAIKLYKICRRREKDCLVCNQSADHLKEKRRAVWR